MKEKKPDSIEIKTKDNQLTFILLQDWVQDSVYKKFENGVKIVISKNTTFELVKALEIK